MTISGQGGAIKWGYMVVASLGPWRFEGTGKSGSLTAAVTAHDAFRLTQRPLLIVVPAGNTELRWPVESVSVDGGRLSAVTGPREKRG